MNSTADQRPIRILTLAHVFPRTRDDVMGAFLLHLADALAACGIGSVVVAPHAPMLAGEETIGSTRVCRFRYAPVRWERLGYTGTMHELVGRGVWNKILFVFFNLAFLFKTVAVVRSARPDVLHAHWWLPDGVVGAFASLITRVPLVITTHGTDVEMLRRTRWALPLARFTFACARSITCGSTYLSEQLLALHVATGERVCVIPMPVHPRFESAQRSQSPSSNLVLTVARLTTQKSIDTLIDAVSRVPAARLAIIGDGPARASLEQRVRDLGVQDRVEFLGARPQAELPPYYAECAVFVLTSLREGMGLVFAEALLCGAPVIAASAGGATDIVKDGETGLLVPERDAPALAGAITKLLTDRGLAARLAANGAAWVRARYTREPVARQFVEVYERVLER